MSFRHLLALTLLILPSISAAIDLQPNDIVAPQPGKSHAMISYVNTENTTFYRNGSAVSTKPYGSPDINKPF